MCICMTEEQKKVINETGNMMVIDFKRILNKIKLSFEELCRMFGQILEESLEASGEREVYHSS